MKMNLSAFKKSLSLTGEALKFFGVNYILFPVFWTVMQGINAKEKISDMFDKINLKKFIELVKRLEEISKIESNQNAMLEFGSGEKIILLDDNVIFLNLPNADDESSNKDNLFIIQDMPQLFERIEILKFETANRKSKLKEYKAQRKADKKLAKFGRFRDGQFKSLKAADITMTMKSRTDQFKFLAQQFKFLSLNYNSQAISSIDEIKGKIKSASYMRFWAEMSERDINMPFLPLLWSRADLSEKDADSIEAKLERVYLSKDIKATAVLSPKQKAKI